jgi:hypothetical protein
MEEEIKLVVLDNGRIMAVFEGGSMLPVYADESGVWVDLPKK